VVIIVEISRDTAAAAEAGISGKACGGLLFNMGVFCPIFNFILNQPVDGVKPSF
jgi:hypothetical protein